MTFHASFSGDLRRPIRVVAPGRVHITLLDMGRCTARACGGVGFAIAANRTEWQFSAAKSTSLDGIDVLDKAAQIEISQLISAIMIERKLPCTAIKLIRAPRQHFGFGAKTALLTSLLYGLFEHHMCAPSLDEVRALSGRGGTSGIGLHAMFLGGIIWDGGHLQSAYPEFAPSSARAPCSPPILCSRWPFPEELEVLLFNGDGSRVSGKDELRLFSNSCPVPQDEVARTFFAVFHGVIPSFLSSDLPGLRASLAEVHGCGFKARELHAQAPKVKLTYRRLTEIVGVAPGLSSVGPLVYAVLRKDDRNTLAALQDCARRNELPAFEIAQADNVGIVTEAL
ncbi:beta-ribofuranosylaminobenzene 5'-phosphate synthase family protein [Rhodoplanes roseus]|uniref:Beta-ribofuranosylaminobenzene 5'-phosphate synthase n=1 Tax=Rhodoplanes roseus TaxID=29409 RepID=A0A327KQJ4_9BRAD|nr:hypothetical protein CH341_22220 [Rhodoplanes roseus]